MPSDKENFIQTDRISNSPPILQRKLKKIPVTAGKSIRWKIPADTFYDPEEGNTRKLKLSVRRPNGSLLHGVDWLQFNEQSQVLYLL